MAFIENPKGLKFSDFIQYAEAEEAKAKSLRGLAERKQIDEDGVAWLNAQAAEHDKRANHFRSLAKAMGDTDPATPENL